MQIPQDELLAILAGFNPWWGGNPILDLPEWRREAFAELFAWIESPPVHRALLLSGPRQVGKTTLLLQAIQQLIAAGAPAANILYVTFDHPICKS